MKLEDVVAEPATEPTLMEVPPAPAAIAEAPVAEINSTVTEAIEPAEPSPVPVVITEEFTPKPEPVSESVLAELAAESVLAESASESVLSEAVSESVLPESVSISVLPGPLSEPELPKPAEASDSKVDFLKSLTDAVADQEEKAE